MARANPFRFSTKYQDEETDLLYYGYRYYNPSTGRWLSQDPIGVRGGLNPYSFVRNDSLRSIDALGLIRVGDDDWGCNLCVCKSVAVSFEPGGDNLQLGWYRDGTDNNLDPIFKFGSLIHVKWTVRGHPGFCRYFQDEGGSSLRIEYIIPSIPPFERVGRDGNEIRHQDTDHMGVVIAAGMKVRATFKLHFVFRCVSSGNGPVVTQRLDRDYPSIVIGGDEVPRD